MEHARAESAAPVSFESETFTTILRARLDDAADAPAVTLLDSQAGHRTWTIASLLSDAQAYGKQLRSHGVASGEVVPIILPTSAELIVSYWACHLIGAVPTVLPFPTGKIDPERYYAALPALLDHCDVRRIVTYGDLSDILRRLRGKNGREWEVLVLRAATGNGQVDPTLFATPESRDVAILQHSSGTTGLQKGVALRHGDVVRQLRSYGRRIGLRRDDVIVSWLPLYHDMGLIASFVMPVLGGVHVVMMSPFAWVASPHLLFDAIARFQGTLVWQPNFAYNFLSQRIEDRHLEKTRLDSVRGWINCSEPTYASSHRMFLERFGPYGVREETLTVCYAMAENTFAVTQTGFGEPNPRERIDGRTLREQGRAAPSPNDPDAVEMLSAGRALAGHEIRILDETGADVPKRGVGQIAVASDCRMSGYYRRPDLTARVCRDDYFLTGDLGYLADGWLYVVGRKKDLIIIGGKNISPNDVEQVVNEIAGVVPGRAVVFGIRNETLGTEDLAVVAERDDETDRPDKAILLEIRRTVAGMTDVVARHVKLVKRGWLIKTTSGKISRSANQEKFREHFLGRRSPQTREKAGTVR